MKLSEALGRLQATLHRDRPYVLSALGWLTSTDTHHWMTTPVEGLPDFCVSHQALATALKLDPEAQVYSDDEGGVLVKSIRSRTRIKGVMKEYVPLPVIEAELLRIELPSSFRDQLKVLLEWIDDPTMTTVWMQGVHLAEDYLFAANRHEMIVAPGSYPEIAGETDYITLPHWAAKTVAGAKSEPKTLIEYDRGLSVLFADGSRMHSLKLQETVPGVIATFVQKNIMNPVIDSAVPLELREAFDMFVAHKLKTIRLGNDKAVMEEVERQRDIDIEIEGVGVSTSPRDWKIANLQRAMSRMQWMKIDDEGGRWLWASKSYRGIFMGLNR